MYPLQPPAFSPTNDERVLYRNDEAQKGSVNIPVPEWFRDLSLDHKPLGCLTEGVKVTRLVYHSVYPTVYPTVYLSILNMIVYVHYMYVHVLLPSASRLHVSSEDLFAVPISFCLPVSSFPPLFPSPLPCIPPLSSSSPTLLAFYCR